MSQKEAKELATLCRRGTRERIELYMQSRLLEAGRSARWIHFIRKVRSNRNEEVQPGDPSLVSRLLAGRFNVLPADGTSAGLFVAAFEKIGISRELLMRMKELNTLDASRKRRRK